MADGLARQIAGLAGDIRNLGKRIPSYQRGVVANVSPPTVVMDRDVTATPRPVADVLVPGLAVGQRVEVRVIGSRRVITSIHPADNGPDDTDWLALTIPSGYSAVPVAEARRRPDEQVQLRGRIDKNSGNFAGNDVFGWLPAGIRPGLLDRYTTVGSGGNRVIFQVNVEGEMRILNSSSGASSIAFLGGIVLS